MNKKKGLLASPKPLKINTFDAFSVPQKSASQQIIPTKSGDFSNLGITDEELEILANFIPAQEADQ